MHPKITSVRQLPSSILASGLYSIKFESVQPIIHGESSLHIPSLSQSSSQVPPHTPRASIYTQPTLGFISR